MKITFYGTAAGEGWPGVFCQCELCREARRLGGKNIRTRSQALINDDLLIDLPPDNQLHSLYYGLDLGRVRTLLFTHSHSDHCYPNDLELLREPYSHTYPGRMQVFGNAAVGRAVEAACGSLGGECERFDFHEAQADRAFETGRLCRPAPAGVAYEDRGLPFVPHRPGGQGHALRPRYGGLL